jgi:hypothetical protein
LRLIVECHDLRIRNRCVSEGKAWASVGKHRDVSPYRRRTVCAPWRARAAPGGCDSSRCRIFSSGEKYAQNRHLQQRCRWALRSSTDGHKARPCARRLVRRGACSSACGSACRRECMACRFHLPLLPQGGRGKPIRRARSSCAIRHAGRALGLHRRSWAPTRWRSVDQRTRRHRCVPNGPWVARAGASARCTTSTDRASHSIHTCAAAPPLPGALHTRRPCVLGLQ